MSKPLSHLWGELDAARTQKLERLRKYAGLTIPHVLYPLAQLEENHLPQSYQALGQFGVNNLKSILLLTLFPSANPWYRFSLTEQFKLDIAGQLVPVSEVETADALTVAETTAGVAEQMTHGFLETTDYRLAMAMVLEQMIVVGQGMIRLNNDFSHSTYTLDMFTLQRDPEGRVLQIIIKEQVDPYTLDKETLNKINLGAGQIGTTDQGSTAGKEPAIRRGGSGGGAPPTDTHLDMYTRVRWEPETKTWTILQQIRDMDISNEAEEKITPYITPRWTAAPRYDYGIGLVEQIAADLTSYDGIYRGILEGTAASVKHVFLVDPSGLVSRNQLAKAPNLAVLHGRGQDVDVIQTNKGADLRIALEAADRIEKRLGQSMALFTAVQRQAERVTSGETAAVLRELEGTFGNVFGSLRSELQEPYLARFLWQLENNTSKDAPALDRIDRKIITPEVTTGIQALSREVDLQKNMQAVQLVAQLPGMQEKLDGRGMAQMIFNNMGVDPRGLVKSEEQLAVEAQARQQAALRAEASAKAIDVVGNVAENEAKQQGAPAEAPTV